jgi:DNA-binding transcriptional LysR family regulator
MLPAILGRFHRRYPRVELSYCVDNSLVIERRIIQNEIDIGIVGGHLSDESLTVERLVDDEIVFFCGPSHPLAGKRRITADALSSEAWVVREKGSATRQVFERWATSSDLKISRVIELNSPEAIKALVRAGIGISFMSLAGLCDEMRRGTLRRLRVQGAAMTRPILTVRHPGKQLSPSMERFLAMLRGVTP